MDIFKNQLEQLKQRFNQELKSVRSSRVNTAILEDLSVDAYGKKNPLKHVAHLSIFQNNIIKVEPWDQTVLDNIERSIKEQNLGFGISREAKTIKIMIPPLSQEQREKYAKLLSSKKEEIKKISRNVRDEFLKRLKKDSDAKKISEDEYFRAKKHADEAIEKFNKEIDIAFSQKEKEIVQA